MEGQSADIKRVFKNTVFLYARMLIVMAVSLYTVRVILSALGAEDYGIYNVVGGIVVMFSFLSRTLASASQRYFAFELGRKDLTQLNKVFCITILLYVIVITIIVLLSETVGLWFLESKMTIPEERLNAAFWIYQFSILSFCFILLMTPYQAILIAREDMNVYAIVGVLEAILYMVVALIIKRVSYDRLISYGFLMMCVSIAVNSIYYLYARAKYAESKFRKYWDRNLVLEMSSYSGWNIFGALANIARSQGINILINVFFNPTINAARGLAYQVSGTINSFASNFYTAVRPQVTKQYAAGNVEETNNLVFSSSKLSYYLILIFALPIIVFVHPILSVWLVDVPQYTELFVTLVIIVALIDSLSNPLMTLVQATGRVKVYQLIVSSMLIMNLPISWFLLHKGFPAEATMYTAILISGILLFLRIYILKRMIMFPAKEYYTQILFRVLLSTVIGLIYVYVIRILLYSYALDSVWVLFLVLTLSVIGCAFLIIICGLNKQERLIVLSFVRKKLGINDSL